jgi:hypothetical protein
MSFLSNTFVVRIMSFSYQIPPHLICAKLASLIPSLDNWAQDSPRTFDYIAGLLPPIAYSLFDAFFCSMVFRLSRYQGSTTRSRLQSATLARHFAFSVISELIIFTLIGALFSTCCIILVFGC